MGESAGVAWIMRIRKHIRKHGNCVDFVDLLFEDHGTVIDRVFLSIRFHMIECYHSEHGHSVLGFEGNMDFGVLWMLNEVEL